MYYSNGNYEAFARPEKPKDVDKKSAYLVGSGLAQYTWTASLAELPASTCSLFYPLQPMFSALLGMLLLNETFTPSFLVGLVLISADVILSTLETRKLAKQAQAGSDR